MKQHAGDVEAALAAFQAQRLPQTSQEVRAVLHCTAVDCVLMAVTVQRCCLHAATLTGRLRAHTHAAQVMFSRHVGELRMGQWFDPEALDWPAASSQAKWWLLNAGRSLPDFKGTALPVLLDRVHKRQAQAPVAHAAEP